MLQFPLGRVSPAAMIVAPLLLLASSTAFAFGAGFGKDVTGGTLLVWAGSAFALAVPALTAQIAPARRVLAEVLTVCGVIGSAGAVAFGLEAIYAAASSGTRVLTLSVPVGVMGLVFPLTMIAIGLAVAALRIRPMSGLLLAAAGVLFPVSRVGQIEILAIAVDLLFVAALVPVGLAQLRQGQASRVPR